MKRHSFRGSLLTSTLLCLCPIGEGVVVAQSTAPAPIFNVSYSKQPEEVMKAALLNRIKGIAIYSAMACNPSTVSGTLSGGFVLQGATPTINVVDSTLAQAVVTQARGRSKKGIAAEIAVWTALLAPSVYTGGIIALSASAMQKAGVINSILGLVSKKLETDFANAGVPFNQLQFWTPGTSMTIAPQSCATGVFLGSWSVKAGFKPYTAQITGAPK